MKLLSVLFWTELVYVSIGIVFCRYTVKLLVILILTIILQIFYNV